MEKYVFSEVKDSSKAVDLYEKGILFVNNTKKIKIFEDDCNLDYFIDIANQEGTHRFLSMEYRRVFNKDVFHEACSNNKKLLNSKNNILKLLEKDPVYRKLSDLNNMYSNNYIYIPVNEKDIKPLDVNIYCSSAKIIKNNKNWP